jgi:hypothetical protein
MTMSDPLQASNAWAMGNLGLSTALRGEPDMSSYDVEDLADTSPAPSWLMRLRGRLARWTLGVCVVLAFMNHWPGGHR